METATAWELSRLPMLNGARIALKLSGIQAVKGGCVVAGRAEIAEGLPLLQLDAKLRENLLTLSMANQLVANAGQTYAKEIAQGVNATIEAINALAQKITEKKRNTRELLANFSLDQEEVLKSNCATILSDSYALQDSLEKIIGLVKAGKLKANLAKLQTACRSNIEFLNTLAPALARCNGLSAPPTRSTDPCNGQCNSEWDFSWIESACAEEMKHVFGVTNETPDIGDYELIFTKKITLGSIETSCDKNPEMCYHDNPEFSYNKSSKLDLCGKIWVNLIYSGGLINQSQINMIITNFRLLFDKKGLNFIPDHFIKANGKKMLLDDSKVNLKKVVENSRNFKTFDEKIYSSIIDLLKRNKFIDSELVKINQQNGFNPVDFSEMDFSIIPFTEMFLVMGGTKQTDVNIRVYKNKSFSKKMTIQIDYIFRDTFGADFEDVNCNGGSKNFIEPLKHFFLLQHYSDICKTCRPFQTEYRYQPQRTLFFQKP